MRLARCLAVFVLTLTWHVGPAHAQLGSRSADEWIKTLESPQRIQGLKIDETVAALTIKPGNVVADIGAGTGLFEVALAKAVGTSGKVYAEDVDQGLIDAVTRKKEESRVPNIVPVLGGFTDPKLPANDVDLAMINDVLHHIDDRATYLKNLAKYIKPGGRIAVIDFHPERGGHRTQPELQVSKEQATKWMADAGLMPVQEVELFADKYFVIFGKR
jgi:ubiquinone/menaquinone biosynthesis C-methylase UbiE